jgi:hypothetical protein
MCFIIFALSCPLSSCLADLFYLVWSLCHFSIIVDKFREKFHTEAVIGNHVRHCRVILVPRAGYVSGSAGVRINYCRVLCLPVKHVHLCS